CLQRREVTEFWRIEEKHPGVTTEYLHKVCPLRVTEPGGALDIDGHRTSAGGEQATGRFELDRIVDDGELSHALPFVRPKRRCSLSRVGDRQAYRRARPMPLRAAGTVLPASKKIVVRSG